MAKAWKIASVILGLALALGAVSGCEQTPAETRGNPSDLTVGDSGLQSKDLIQMTDEMAPDLLKIDEIARNPQKVVVVMKGIENQTGDPTQNMNIYVARLRTLLNEHSRDRMTFVEERQTSEQLQGQEGIAGGRLLPQFALKGVFMSMDRANSHYYLCTFQLTNITTGVISWEGHYEVKTLE